MEPSDQCDSGWGGDRLTGVAAAASDYVWAVGHEAVATNRVTLTERWTGTSWSQVTSPSRSSQDNYLMAVAAGPGYGSCANSDSWAAGYSITSGIHQTLILRYTVPAPCSNSQPPP